MKKKVLAGILAATMAFSMAACGSTGSSSDSGSSAASGSTAKTEEKGEPYTVTMVLQGSQQQDEERIEEKINEILEPELNAKLDIVVLPWASASQQLQLMLSGDEKIDLLYTNATTAVQYMHSGQIMDMSELIDKYGTNLKDIYGEDIAKTNQIDGFVYGVPNQIERGSIPAIFMRKDLVEKYNINTDEIKEPKDMEKVFETVQAGEPDMTMLFSSNNSDTPLSRLSRADGLGDANTGALMDQTNSTTVENYFASDWYKETATMLHDWYQKGYISKDAGTNTENWRTVCKAGNLFSLFFAYHPGTPVEFQSSTGYEFEIVPFYDQPIINSSSYSGIIYSIAQNSENPEKAIDNGGNACQQRDRRLQNLIEFSRTELCHKYGAEQSDRHADQNGDSCDIDAANDHGKDPVLSFRRFPCHTAQKFQRPDLNDCRKPVCEQKDANQRNGNDGDTCSNQEHNLHDFFTIFFHVRRPLDKRFIYLFSSSQLVTSPT